MTWPAIFEDRLHSLRDTDKMQMRAQYVISIPDPIRAFCILLYLICSIPVSVLLKDSADASSNTGIARRQVPPTIQTPTSASMAGVKISKTISTPLAGSIRSPLSAIFQAGSA